MHLKDISRISKRLPILISAIAAWAFHTWLLNQWLGFDFNLAATDALATILWIMLSAGVMELVVMQYSPKNGRYQFLAGLALILAAISFWAAIPALEYYGKENETYLKMLANTVPIRVAFTFVLVFAAGVLILFAARLRDLEESAEQRSATESMVREAELQKLQLQLQPHFLFNSLNSINALMLVQPPKAREMVQQLSDFLRATLKRADEQWITLAQEADYLKLYLAIEKVRFGHRLDVQMNLDEQIQMWFIPPLLLQPLVENAIKFGLYGTTDKVTIYLNTQREGNALQVEISNPFDTDMQPPEGSGFGLAGLKRRLYLLYARNDLLTTRMEGNQFFVRLMLPEKYD
ncbi:MAG: sensor histidine kinase [Flammeovirgaceae bacterium]